ncbi:MAG: class I SAM-dependent methyltransferase [Anaerolineales bacterium]|nr:class I SAM-dependent methyltransferase [Anaerolineales bacterium]
MRRVERRLRQQRHPREGGKPGSPAGTDPAAARLADPRCCHRRGPHRLGLCPPRGEGDRHRFNGGDAGQNCRTGRPTRLEQCRNRPADAETLPFDAASFDLVTCRLALHHFPNPRQALSEFARVLKPGGVLGFTDNVTVPDKQAAGYYNAYEKLRDPSHHWVYPLVRLQAMFADADLTVAASRELSKELEFHDWADRQHVSAANKDKLLEMMRQLPPALEPLFAPRWAEGTLYFSLWEAVIVGRRGG